jgi:hypothetical protein
MVFAEPGSEVPPEVPVVRNPQKLGVWHNWLQSCQYGLESGADYVMTVQDDAVFHPDSRSFATQHGRDVLSLYCAKHYARHALYVGKAPGVFQCERTEGLWGALALVFARTTLQKLIEHDVAKTWRGITGKKRGDAIANVDTAIGKIMSLLSIRLWMIHPSPVRHISLHSTIGHGGNKGRRNCYISADDSQPLESQVFPGVIDPDEVRRAEAIARLQMAGQ